MAEPRTPESLTRLERKWLSRRTCAWCDAYAHRNTCYAMYSEPCTDEFLNARRGRWLAEDYKPRRSQSAAHEREEN